MMARKRHIVASGSFLHPPGAGTRPPDSSLGANSAKGVPPPGGAAVTADLLGRLMGVSQRTVRDLATRGIVVKAGGRGLYDLPRSVAGYCAHLRDQAAGRAGDAQAGLAAQRARQAKEQADALAMKNAVARGELVPASDVRTTWAAILTDVRSSILAVPSRLPELTRDQAEKLDRELRIALETLAHG